MLLDAALRCLMAIKNVGRAIEHFFCLRFSFDAKVSKSMNALILWSTAQEAQETLEMLDGMLDSFGHPELSST